MQTFTCPSCGETRTGQRRRCYPCTVRQSPESRERIRRALTGVRHSEERRLKNSESHKGQVNRFDLAALARGKPSPQAKPVGSKRIDNGHIKVKCPDGKWRYEHRLVWEAAHGPITSATLIHHRNHDPFDNRLANLQALTRSEHMRIHTAGERGKQLSQAGLAARYGKK